MLWAMEAKGNPLSARAHVVLIKDSLRTSDLHSALMPPGSCRDKRGSDERRGRVHTLSRRQL